MPAAKAVGLLLEQTINPVNRDLAEKMLDLVEMILYMQLHLVSLNSKEKVKTKNKCLFILLKRNYKANIINALE